MKYTVDLKKDDTSCYEFAVGLVGGNASALARILKCSPQAVVMWRQRGTIPPERAKEIARIFNVSASKLNPIFCR